MPHTGRRMTPRGGRWMAGALGMGGIWQRSYRKPISFFVYGQYVAYTVNIQDGAMVIGYPPGWDSPALRQEALQARHLRNEDVQWVLIPVYPDVNFSSPAHG